jgi:mono/diheme cytochrome c family protein
MKTMPIAFALGALAVTGLVATGCGKPPDAPGTSRDQVAEGAPLYVAHCAKCHGPTGAGMGHAPAVVGKNALPLNPPPGAQHRTSQFRTARDVLDFVRANMPADNPGSLSETQYADILAFDLKLNGLDLHHERVNEENAGNFVLHPDTFQSQSP